MGNERFFPFPEVPTMGWIVLLIKSCIKTFVLAVDSLFERSLLKVVPDLEHVLYDPNEALRGRHIVIGPARKYGTILALLLLGTLAGGVIPAVFPLRLVVFAIVWALFLVSLVLLISGVV